MRILRALRSAVCRTVLRAPSGYDRKEMSPDDLLAVGGIDDREFAEALAETTQTLVCVLDRHGRILLFNDAYERAIGYARDEVLGEDARDFVIPAEEREAFGEVLTDVWETGHPSPQVGHWVRKDGGRRLIAWSNRPVLGERGTPRYLVTSGLVLSDPQPDPTAAARAEPA